MSSSSLIAIHLSRLAEELVIWSSDRFNFVKLPESYTTGSSIMPQKRNPDAAELIRAKPGRIFGNLLSLMTVLKGLPMTYGKDMQEDKEPIFDTTRNIELCILNMNGMIKEIEPIPAKMMEALQKGFPTATDLADYLVKNLEIPFREAHRLTGKIVLLAETKMTSLENLTLEDIQSVVPNADLKILEVENPTLNSDSVRIEVVAAGVNFPDVLIIQGKYQYKPNFPFSPGSEVAGEAVSYTHLTLPTSDLV